jgi:hypothetical protein
MADAVTSLAAGVRKAPRAANVQEAAADKRSEQTYLDAEAGLKEAEKIREHLAAQDAALEALAAKLDAVLPAPPVPKA